jgi:hypothetical protein
MNLTHDCRSKQSADSTLKRASERAAEVLSSIEDEFGEAKVLDSDLWLYDDYICYTIKARYSVDPEVVDVEGVEFKERQRSSRSFGTLVFEIDTETV